MRRPLPPTREKKFLWRPVGSSLRRRRRKSPSRFSFCQEVPNFQESAVVSAAASSTPFCHPAPRYVATCPLRSRCSRVRPICRPAAGRDCVRRKPVGCQGRAVVVGRDRYRSNRSALPWPPAANRLADEWDPLGAAECGRSISCVTRGGRTIGYNRRTPIAAMSASVQSRGGQQPSP